MKIRSLRDSVPQAVRYHVRGYAVEPGEPRLAAEYVVETTAPTIVRLSSLRNDYFVQLGDVRASVHLREECDPATGQIWVVTEVSTYPEKGRHQIVFRHDPSPGHYLTLFRGNPCYMAIRWLIRQYPDQGVNRQ